MEIGIKERLEHWKIKAELFLKEDKRVLIKDLYDNWYFADLILIGENILKFKCYAPEQRAGQEFTKYWADITYFDEDKNE